MKKCCFYVFLALLVLLILFFSFPKKYASAVNDCAAPENSFEGCWQYSYSPYYPNEKGIFGPVLQQSGTMVCDVGWCEDGANGLLMSCRQESNIVLCEGMWMEGRFGGFTAELEGNALTNSDIFVAERMSP